MARATCNLVATLHVSCGRLISTPLTRRYSNIDSALANILKWLRHDGFVGDKIVVHHALTGLELGVARMTTAREVKSVWHYEKETS